VSDELLSPSWYRVSGLRPSLRQHARFHRHVYRGQAWHVVQDRASGRCHRLTPAAHQIAARMDGQRTVQQLWDEVCTRLGDAAPTQDETIRLLGILHAADVLRCDVAPDVEEIFRRSRRRQRQALWQRLSSPLFLKVPLADPDAWLTRWAPVVAPLFGRAGAAACALPVLAALVFAAVHSGALAEAGPSGLLETRNLLILWLVFPAIKAVHELGHAFATKVWGGEVHEVGVLFLVLVPIPYVDASAASAFAEKPRRVLVGAAGILVEVVLASLALLVWLAAEPGVVRDVAYTTFWIGGASTLLFNGNPLLRFDGYYVLADAIEIPNLKQRSSEYLSWLVLHRVFGVEQARCPLTAPGEAGWLAVYGIASFGYRLLVSFGIAVFISQKFFLLGTILAITVVATGVVVPAFQKLGFLLTSPRLGEQRPRALALSGAAAALAVALFFFVPAPIFTTTQGVIWPPEHSQVRAGGDGFVVRLLAEPGAPVRAGQPLVLTRDAVLETDARVLEAELLELRARRHGEASENRGRARKLDGEIAAAEAALARARERVGDVVVRSPGEGRFVVPDAQDLVGRFVAQGEPLGWVVGPGAATVRVVVPQADVDLVRSRTRSVQVRLASRIAEVIDARIRREVPAASDRLPTAALGAAGGGPFALDPGDESGLRTRQTVFQFDLGLDRELQRPEVGTRVHVRFAHGWEPLSERVGRSLRRLFLSRLRA
jgi:putative peptide zinc metalloprotease protein